MKLQVLLLPLAIACSSGSDPTPPPIAICSANACGGCGSLEGAPGEACGRGGALRCETRDTLVCDESSQPETPSPSDPPEAGCEPWLVGGRVAAMESVGNRLYLGGTFSYVGPRTGSFAMLDRSSGA